MNCRQIREEIGAASRYDMSGAIRSHLNGCPDCRRYSEETASLLSLLGAQPRVEAPADFEFRLRARMARAQATADSEGQSFLRGILREKLPESFSWGQIAAAAATLALALTFSTFYVKRDDRAAGAIDPGGDVSASNPQSNVAAGAELSPGIEALASEYAATASYKFASRSSRVELDRSQAPDLTESQIEIPDSPTAEIDGLTRLYNPETKRLLNDRSRFYGAETVSISLSKPAGAALTF
jgi:hypothetical protein